MNLFATRMRANFRRDGKVAGDTFFFGAFSPADGVLRGTGGRKSGGNKSVARDIGRGMVGLSVVVSVFVLMVFEGAYEYCCRSGGGNGVNTGISNVVI